MRGVRSLELLSKNASSSRVLNLHRIYSEHSSKEEHRQQPFFLDDRLNTAIIIKHRLRKDEAYLMPRANKVATKIVFPITRTDLRQGGQSVFVGQRGYRNTMLEYLGEESESVQRDLDVLDMLNRLPSLDPFLLREQMRLAGYQPAEFYFEISPADIAAMQAFACEQVMSLINRAFQGVKGGVSEQQIAKLVEALLGSEPDERLQPLRPTLGLDAHSFRDGMFSWKGFLYYKWQLDDVLPTLTNVSYQLDKVKLIGHVSSNTLDEIAQTRESIRRAIVNASRACKRLMALYDRAFQDLVDKSNALAFRQFLLDAPQLFVELGQLMGVICHIASFWRFRFPDESRLTMDGLDYADILLEFDNSLDIGRKIDTRHAA